MSRGLSSRGRDMPEPFEINFQFRNKRFKDASIGLNAFADKLGKGIERAGPGLSKEMRKYLEGVAQVLANRHGNPWPKGTTDQNLSRRSGKALRSIRSSIRVVGRKVNEIQGEIGGVFYLKTHEQGATIRAKKSKFLTIPLPAALNKNGTPRVKKARDWDNTFVAKSKKGNLIIFQKRGKKIVPLYVLKTQVRIPKRLGMERTLKAGIPIFVDRAMDRMLKELL